MENELNSGTIFKDSESDKQIEKKGKSNKSENQEEWV